MSSSDLENLKKAILQTDFDNPNHSENLNYLLGRYQKELEAEERRRWSVNNKSETEKIRERREQERLEQEHLQQKYGKFVAFFVITGRFWILLLILLLLLGSNDWWLLKLLLTIFIFLLKVLYVFVVFVVHFFSMGTGG